MSRDVSSAALNAAPAVSVTAATAVGHISLQQWVFILTLAYIGLQIAYLCWKWWRELHRRFRVQP